MRPAVSFLKEGNPLCGEAPGQKKELIRKIRRKHNLARMIIGHPSF